jgi:N-methylhydantoinase A
VAQAAFSHPLASLTSSILSDALSETIDSLRSRLNEGGFRNGDSKIEINADMRYVGQHYELNIQLPLNEVSGVPGIGGLAEKFSDTHETAYGYCNSALPVEIAGLRVDAIGRLTKPSLPEIASVSRKLEPSGNRKVSLALGQPPVNADIYQRADLCFGDMIAGPVIIEQMDTTTLILDKQRAQVSAYGFLRITELN